MPTMREAYRKDMQEQLARLEVDMAELRAQSVKAAAQDRDEIERELDALETEHKNLKDHLESVDFSQDSSWDMTKLKMDKAWTDLEQRYEKAKASIRSSFK